MVLLKVGETDQPVSFRSEGLFQVGAGGAIDYAQPRKMIFDFTTKGCRRL